MVWLEFLTWVARTGRGQVQVRKISRMQTADSHAFEVPVLHTERLTLRGHRLDDVPDCTKMWGDAEVTRYIGGKPSTSQQVWMRVLSYAGHWRLLGFGYWVAQETQTGKFVGELGFADFKRDIEPSMAGAPELGWALTPEMHGKGYATEAVRAALAWGDKNFASARTVCIISPENLASIRVAQKCGYAEIARTTFGGSATIMYERLRAQ